VLLFHNNREPHRIHFMCDCFDTDLPFLTSGQLSVSLDKMSCDVQSTKYGNNEAVLRTA
jgi:hypothetical protein